MHLVHRNYLLTCMFAAGGAHRAKPFHRFLNVLAAERWVLGMLLWHSLGHCNTSPTLRWNLIAKRSVQAAWRTLQYCNCSSCRFRSCKICSTPWTVEFRLSINRPKAAKTIIHFCESASAHNTSIQHPSIEQLVFLNAMTIEVAPCNQSGWKCHPLDPQN